MDLSGVIFVALALAWAGYLIPKALKHHDEVARNRSVDRFSAAMRVLARRESTTGGEGRLVVTPARSATTPRVLVPGQGEGTPGRSETSPGSPRHTAAVSAEARREASRVATRRRRRVLLALLGADAVCAGLAWFALLAWWSLGVPGAVTLLWLVLCRTQVRAAGGTVQETAGDQARGGRLDVDPALPGADAAAPGGVPAAAPGARASGADPDQEDTVRLDVGRLDTGRVAPEGASAAPGQGSLWDPLPVTLPTYVTKPAARRTVRTIDLDQPGTWSSGRSAADSRLVEQAAAQEAAENEQAAPGLEPEDQRAVGS